MTGLRGRRVWEGSRAHDLSSLLVEGEEEASQSLAAWTLGAPKEKLGREALGGWEHVQASAGGEGVGAAAMGTQFPEPFPPHSFQF